MVSDVTPCQTLSPGVPRDWKILNSWSISELPRNKTSRLLKKQKQGPGIEENRKKRIESEKARGDDDDDDGGNKSAFAGFQNTGGVRGKWLGGDTRARHRSSKRTREKRN